MTGLECEIGGGWVTVKEVVDCCRRKGVQTGDVAKRVGKSWGAVW